MHRELERERDEERWIDGAWDICRELEREMESEIYVEN